MPVLHRAFQPCFGALDRPLFRPCRPNVAQIAKKEGAAEAAPSGGLDGDGRMADGHGCGEQALIEFICRIFVHVGKHMGVGVKGDAHIGMSKTVLDDLCADSCGDQCGGIAVAQIVQTDFREIRLIYEAFPLLGDGVRMEGLAIFLAEHIAQITEARFLGSFIVDSLRLTQSMEHTINLYIEYRQNSEWNSEKDCDIITIKHFYLKTEVEIKDAILRLPAKLDQGYIPYCDYGALFNYLLAIKYEAGLNIDIRHIENIIVSKLSKSTSEITIERIFNSEYHLTDKKALSELDAFKKRISHILQKKDTSSFSYNPETLNVFYTKNIEKLKEKKTSTGFACQLDATQFVRMLKKASASQIHIVRQLFTDLYLTENKMGRIRKHYISHNDLQAIKVLHHECSGLPLFEEYDRIQRLQINWFMQNLEEIIEKFGPIYASNEEDGDEFDGYRGDGWNAPDNCPRM